MKVTFWGTRGSLASPGPETVRYGGNTACVAIRDSSGGLIILDAGTGIRRLGATLGDARTIHLFLTHLHLDHVQGLGFFAPLFRPEVEVHIWGPPSLRADLATRLNRYLSPPLFPVRLKEVPSRVTLHPAPMRPIMVGNVQVVAELIIHPGPTVGYRIESKGRVLAYLTDHEPALGADLANDSSDWISGFALAYRADVLIHDCQFTPQEYESRLGWGHSTTEHVARFAEKAEVDRLLLFHHDPMHSDDQLDAMRDDVLAGWGVDGDRCTVAAEGAELVV